ncbi:MAG: ABC transporter permease [Nocardioides sp.]|uniref:ABC transporter permease n=1 Tax=Nocardioides sp. TaxID=35761 RepID=UPI0039E4A839
MTAARVARGVAVAVGTLLVISIVTFAATNLSSGPEAQARAALGREAMPEQIDAFKQQYGLDKPFPERYVSWLGDFVQGDWGESPITGRSVAEDALPRLQRTLILMLLAIVIGMPLAILVGVVCAVRAGGKLDRSTNLLIVIMAALPEFVLGIGLITLFSVWIPLFPADSSGLLFGNFVAKAQSYVLPALTLGIAVVPPIVRLTRAAVLEVIPAPYVRAATLRGLPQKKVVSSYLLPNAAGPMANVIAQMMVYLLGGTIVVEQVFSFPGLGRRLVEAIGQGDTVTVQALALAIAVLTLVISYGTDAVVRLANPRLRALR